jgi:sulfhydrogenase subunit gamma (sulfur reductase)
MTEGPTRFSVPHSLYSPLSAVIVEVHELTQRDKLFRIELPGGKDLGHRPGQFVQVSLPGSVEAPFSVASSPTRRGWFELGVRRAGRLTNALHLLKAGDSVGIRGPFGRPFDIGRMAGGDLLCIAGGCGLAPLRSLIQFCEDRPDEFGSITVLYGAQNPEDLLFREDLHRWRRSGLFACVVAVDHVPAESCHDGPVGLITDLIPPLAVDPERTWVTAVGPPAMYRAVMAELHRKGIAPERIALSLERHMRCGVGKCGHCTIDHLYCCLDGPVFWLNEIVDLPGAL